MPLDIASFLAPVTTEHPAGHDARDSAPYEAVAAEMEKLTSLSNTGAIDWGKVAQQGEHILAHESKDFMMAAWVSEAWLQCHGMEGLIAGLQLHAGLIHTYWETAFPVLKRIRGRRNALEWWLDRIQNWLDQNTPAPMESSVHDTLIHAITTLDTELAEKDPESPPLAGLIRQLKQLDVIEAPSAAAPLAEQPHEQTSIAPAPVPSAPPESTAQELTSQPQSTATATHTPAVVAAPLPAASAPVPHQAAATASAPTVSLPNTSALVSNTHLSSVDEIIHALEPASHYLAQISTALLSIERFHPLVIEISRFAARCRLTQAPPATDGVTALVAPPVAILDAFARIQQSDNPEGLIEFSESRIAAFPFWLDLDHSSARGFSLLGPPGAAMHQAIIKNVVSFVERLPGIETLQFSDGTPFACDATRQWIEQCRAENQGSSASEDPVDQTQHAAKQMIRGGHFEEAESLYQQLIQSTRKGRDQFRARISLIELLMTQRPTIDAQPFIAPLIEECLTRDLASWEPELAAQIWALKIKALRTSITRQQGLSPERSNQLETELIEALQRLSVLDFNLATRLA